MLLETDKSYFFSITMSRTRSPSRSPSPVDRKDSPVDRKASRSRSPPARSRSPPAAREIDPSHTKLFVGNLSYEVSFFNLDSGRFFVYWVMLINWYYFVLHAMHADD